MDAELMALASSAATALVGAMTQDGWEQVKQAVTSLWRRNPPSHARAVEQALDKSREELVTAAAADLERLAVAIEGRWQGRLEALLEEHPQSARDLAILADRLCALAGSQEATTVVQRVHAERDAYTAGRDQHINQGLRH